MSENIYTLYISILYSITTNSHRFTSAIRVPGKFLQLYHAGETSGKVHVFKAPIIMCDSSLNDN